MRFDENQGCPLNGMKTCKKVRQKNGCAWWMWFTFNDPTTGDDVAQHACAMVWGPYMSMKAAQESRQGAAATESFRNELVRRIDRKQVEKKDEINLIS
jgi:hypothetical protein